MGNDISSTYTQIGAKFLNFTKQPPFPQNQKFFEDGGKNEGIAFIRQSIRNLQEMFLEVFKCIRENEKDICKDSDMKELVRECIDNSFDTSRFYFGLAESLEREKAKQRIIEIALQKTGAEGGPLSETQVMKIKEKLIEFESAEDPFKDFLQQYEPLLEKHEETRKKVEKKIKEMGRKRKAKRVWKILSRIILVVAAVTLAVCCALVVAFALPVPAVLMAITFYTSSMLPSTQFVFSFLKEENESADRMELLVQNMEKNTSITVNEMKKFRSSVQDHLDCFRTPIAYYVKNYLKDDDVLNFAEIAKKMKELQQPLMQMLDDLRKDVDRCAKELEKQRERIIWA